MCGSHPRPIISPSVLASDFGNLSNEVKRMMSEGAEWVHMGKLTSFPAATRPSSSLLSPLPPRCHGRVSLQLDCLPSVVLALTSRAVLLYSHFVPNITMGPPVLASVYKTVPNVFMDCHMMVADPAAVRSPLRCMYFARRADTGHVENHRSGSSLSQKLEARATPSTLRHSLNPVSLRRSLAALRRPF